MDKEPDRSFFYQITSKDKNQRIDIYLASQINDLTRSRVQDLIRNGFVKVNDHPQKTSYHLKIGDDVKIFIPPPRPNWITPEPIEYSTIYEDSSIIVLDKPAGLVIHPAPGHYTGTLVHGLLRYCDDLSGIGGVLRPGIIHRLDKDTSGLLVVAKNDRAHTSLSMQFKNRKVKKQYFAIVHGIIPEEKGEIDIPIARHPKRRKEMAVSPSGVKTARTLWRKMEKFQSGFSLLLVTTKTGRTHQIRVHLSYIGHPIVGDDVYGYKQSRRKKYSRLEMDILSQIKRQMLHAETIGFIHPDSDNYCEFKAPLPDDMAAFLKKLRSINH